jgi:Dyp-type peroxidase family
MAHGLSQPTMQATLAITQNVFLRGGDMFGTPRPLGFYLWPKYGAGPRIQGLKQILGDTTRLRDLQHNVLITAFDLDNEYIDMNGKRDRRTWKPKLFHNFAGDKSDGDMLAWKVALYSTAAPGYFPTADGFIDGGVYANNPSMCALAQVFDLRYAPDPKPDLKDVLLLSVGAGQNLDFITGPTHEWGILRWAPEYVSMTTDGTVGIADYQCGRLLQKNYYRLAPEISKDRHIDLDAVDSIGLIADLAQSFENTDEFKNCVDWLEKKWMEQLPSRALRTRGLNLPERTSKHVGTATELTCLMPIKQGFLPTLDTMTYATRLRIVFKVLQTLRTLAREERTIKPIVDIVDAARTVQSFSWTVVADQQLLLTVAFDRPWEPYIRVVWEALGPLIDLFLCNCEGFVPSAEGFDRFAQFVRDHQVDTGFFYPSSSLTIDDDRYLVEFEKRQRRDGAGFEKVAATLVTPGPETLAGVARLAHPDQALQQWLAVLNALYDLRNVYPDESPDHVYLHHAATSLLSTSKPKKVGDSAEVRWFDNTRLDPSAATKSADRAIEKRDVQGGILEPYRKVSNACLLLATLEDPAKARRFVGDLADRVTPGSHGAKHDDVVTNVAFTVSGLRQLGVNESVLEQFPKEFREGMQARAGLLGDVRENHPDNWVLPEWNVHYKEGEPKGAPCVEFTGTVANGVSAAPESQDGVTRPPVRLSSVDFVVTVQKIGRCDVRHEWTDRHPLFAFVKDFCAEAYRNGIRVLSLERLHRIRPDAALSRDHFGFLDGISQPNAVSGAPVNRDDVRVGELLIGYQNQRGDAAFPKKNPDPVTLGRGSLIDNGSFLVIRKLRQHVGALSDALDKAVLKLGTSLTTDDLLAKMVGRTRDQGLPLLKDPVPDATPPRNDFDFAGDSKGEVCPFHAHIRRTNPRVAPERGIMVPPVPRIARRGLAYGPSWDLHDADAADRGLMFMAYNASIAEQFEMLQRWLSGGNAPAEHGNVAAFSGQPDPLIGLPDIDGTRLYRFVDSAGSVCHVDLGPVPFVTLQWGLYLFAPSIPALRLLAEAPRPDVVRTQDIVAAGKRVIDHLHTEENWAAALEDIISVTTGVTAAVCAAINAIDRGVKRTPYGVLVVSDQIVNYVLQHDDIFSVSEYQNRFCQSVGKNYLGMDNGDEYHRLSRIPNDALRLVTEEMAYDETHQIATTELAQALKNATRRRSNGAVPIALESVVGVVLAKVAQRWFDIPDGFRIAVGGVPSAADPKPRCPFHFRAPSRYVFSSPNPRPEVKHLGETHGQELLHAVREYVADQRKLERAAGGLTLEGPISRALFAGIQDDDLLARMLLGLVFGFVPTVYTNAIVILGSWIADETLWRLQQRLLDSVAEARYERASEILRKPLERQMQLTAVPPLLYRKVLQPTSLGDCDLKPGDLVVLVMSGAAQEILARGESNVWTVFGGDRRSSDHPTHACPGAHIATGVLLGLTAAILEFGPFAPAEAQTTILVGREQSARPRPAYSGARLAVT